MPDQKQPQPGNIIFEGELPDHIAELWVDGPSEQPEPTTNVSVLLGAGFSAPAGYPTAEALNKRLKKIDASEILIDGSGTSFFLRGQMDNISMSSHYKRFFVQKFLEFYDEKNQKEKKKFNYEAFFDYYIDLKLGLKEDENFNNFCKDFKSEYNVKDENRQLLNEFNQTFQQLIAGELYKKVRGIHTMGGYPGYESFLTLLSQIGETNIVHIHTLNHDLHMEQMEHTDELAFRFSDGFSELGSPYYVRHNGNTIRTRFFNNKFDTRCRLYKLHGSVDNLIYIFKGEKNVIKHVHGARYTEYAREFEDDDGKLKYDNYPWNWFPDFLSGTNAKTRHYSDAYYYDQMFIHFRSNLQTSTLLIVIGYGFGDSEINRIITDEFLTRDNVKLIVIKRTKPNSSIMENSKVQFISTDVSKIVVKDVLTASGIIKVK